jgi:thiamine pyrophosphokinase
MAVGLVLLSIAIMVRCWLEGIDWLDTVIANVSKHLHDTKQQIISAKENKNTKDLIMVGATIVLLMTVGTIFYTNTMACQRDIQAGTYYPSGENTLVQSQTYLSNATSNQTNLNISELTDHIVRIRTYSNTTKEYVISNTTIKCGNITIPEINVTLMRNVQLINYMPNIDHIYLLNSTKEYVLTVNNISYPLDTDIIKYDSSVPLDYPEASDYRVDV